MPTPRWGALTAGRVQSTIREIAFDILQLLPVAAFLFVSSTPAESLAFVADVELSHQPLIFTRDPSLASSAIIGIEASPKHTTAGALLEDQSSHIPTASPYIFFPGVAVRALATAYSSTADQADSNPFITASGTRVHPGTLAANFLPFGTTVRIGNQLYTVEDRLNARYDNTLIVDVWQPTRAAALQFGARVVEMEIITLGR